MKPVTTVEQGIRTIIFRLLMIAEMGIAQVRLVEQL
jgi:hypothetical protein